MAIQCGSGTGPSARTSVEHDGLRIERLLAEIGFVSDSRWLNGRAADSIADLEAVLAADYRHAHGLPGGALARELDRIVEVKIKPYPRMWQSWRSSRAFYHLRTADCDQIVVRARPYRRGSGLALWGFSCNAMLGDRRAFVIYLNTAHDRGAVAATISHELGHYIYDSVAAGCRPARAAMASVFTSHLGREPELFSDSVVALSAYSRPLIRELLSAQPGRRHGANLSFERLQMALRTIDPRYRIDLTRAGLPIAWRIRYLTSLVHFFKLRCALLEAAGI